MLCERGRGGNLFPGNLCQEGSGGGEVEREGGGRYRGWEVEREGGREPASRSEAAKSKISTGDWKPELGCFIWGFRQKPPCCRKNN